MVRLADISKGGVYLLLLFILFPVRAQRLQFAFSESTPPVMINGKTIPFPWTGGFNACHFAAIDLDGDGKDDYIAFDRIGLRVQCFSSFWKPLPGLESALPPLLSWVQTHDYDGDGRKDIFTFNGISGICFYRNESVLTENGYGLKFHKVSDGLPAEMFGSAFPLYCTNTDYPVIADIDGDGDLDVLNFWVPSSGDFLLYYRNFAHEELGRKDTFLLKIDDWSWGCFVESEESNQIFLDSCSDRNLSGTLTDFYDGRAALDPVSRHQVTPKKSPDRPKHAGSTLFAIKSPETDLYNIVVGDVGYPGLLYLHNGGTPQKARIDRYDTVFPLTEPVKLYNFPVLSTIRYRDTLCYVLSPFDTDPFTAEGKESMWRYADMGGGAAYGKLVQKDFLQGWTLDFGVGAVAVAYDYNKDGLPDLVTGNYGNRTDAYYQGGSWYTRMRGSLSLFENTGTEEDPVFEWKTDDYLGLSAYNLQALYPAFSDMDGDGQDEMVLGMEDGRLWLFRLENGQQEAALLDSAFLDTRFSGFSAPVLFDLNNDGLPDLVVGEKQHVWPAVPRRITKGSLTYFENLGSGKKRGNRTGIFRDRSIKTDFPAFLKKTDSLGGVDVIDRNFSNFGYSRPSFFRSGNGEIYLACGSENGEVYLYDRITGNTDGIFRYMGRAAVRCDGNRTEKIRTGLHAAPLLYDWNGDGLPELMVGNQCGGLQYFDGRIWDTIGNVSAEEKEMFSPEASCKVWPNPVREGFHTETDGESVCLLMDMRGRVLRRLLLPAGYHYVDMQGLAPGLYLWQCERNGRHGKVKIIKYQ